MSKTASNHLFQLIKSMTTAEKRYFKIYFSKGNEQSDLKFIKLFQYIDAQDQYDESKILKKDKNLKPLQLSNLKAHLYDQILISLASYNSDNDVEIQIREQLNYTNILYNKSLYEQCWRSLQNGKQLAEKHDKILLMYELVEFEKKLLIKYMMFDIQKDASEIIAESERLIEAIKNTRSFQNLSLKLYALYLQIGFIRNSKDFEIANRFLYGSLPAFDENNLSFNEKMFLYQAFVGYYFFIQDPARANEYAQKLIDLFNENPHLIVPKIEYYIKALNNLISSLYRQFHYTEFVEATKLLDGIDQIEGLKLTYSQKLLKFKYVSIHKLNAFFMTGSFTEGLFLIPQIAGELHQFEQKLDTHNTMLFYYKFASMYFGAQEYNKAIIWLNKIINAKDLNIRSDIQGFSRILNLISHWELKNSDLVDYYIRSTYRFLKKKQDFHLYQKYMLSFLRKLNNSTPDTLIDAFRQLYNELKPLQGNPYEKRAFVYFDILSWLESKFKGIPTQQIIQEKSRKIIERIEAQRGNKTD